MAAPSGLSAALRDESAAQGDSGHASAQGKYGHAAVQGYYGQARAGEDGVLILTWWDGKRPRVVVGYVGENVKADTWYTVNDKGKLKEVSGK